MIIFPDDQIWTSLQVGNLDEKNTEKIQGGTTFEESISLLIYDLANDKVFDKLQTVHSRLQTGFWNVELQNVIFFLYLEEKYQEYWFLSDLLKLSSIKVLPSQTFISEGWPSLFFAHAQTSAPGVSITFSVSSRRCMILVKHSTLNNKFL